MNPATPRVVFILKSGWMVALGSMALAFMLGALTAHAGVRAWVARPRRQQVPDTDPAHQRLTLVVTSPTTRSRPAGGPVSDRVRRRIAGPIRG